MYTPLQPNIKVAIEWNGAEGPTSTLYVFQGIYFGLAPLWSHEQKPTGSWRKMSWHNLIKRNLVHKLKHHFEIWIKEHERLSKEICSISEILIRIKTLLQDTC